jgi:hypothetical protein
MLQAGTPRVRVPMRWILFSICLILQVALSNETLTEVSTRNLPGEEGKGRPALKFDNIIAICEATV